MKTYLIVNASINHPIEGLIEKQNITYYNENDEEELTELYSIRGEIIGYIRRGYSLKTN